MMDKQTQTELEAAAFRGLVEHLQKRTDVQNIDLMNFSGFCRNCLAKWYLAAAQDKGEAIDYEAAREVIYGMPYSDWKSTNQLPASDDQMAKYKATAPDHSDISKQIKG
jgi:hypothetical protein